LLDHHFRRRLDQPAIGLKEGVPRFSIARIVQLNETLHVVERVARNGRFCHDAPLPDQSLFGVRRPCDAIGDQREKHRNHAA
jgi:hypothetical protein